MVKLPKVKEVFERHRGKKAFQKLHEKFLGLYPKKASKFEKFKWLLEKTFWLFVYLSGIVLVVRSAFNLYERYETMPTSWTQMVVQKKTIILPNTTICLPFEPDELFGELNYHSYPTGLLDGEDLYGMNPKLNGIKLQNALKRFFANNQSWHDMQMDTWPIIALYYSHKYLTTISSAEGNKEWDRKGADFLPYSTDPMWTILVENMVRLNVTINQFKQTFGIKFQEFFPITAYKTSITTMENGNNKEEQGRKISSDELVNIEANQVCYRLRLDNIELSTMDVLRIIIDRKNLEKYVDIYCSYCSDSDVSYRSPVIIDISGQAKFYSSTPVKLAYFDHSSLLSVIPQNAFTYQQTVKGTRKCSSTISREACQSECRNKLIVSACKCSASLLPSLPSADVHECSFDVYKSCLHFSGQADEACIDSCLKPCTRWEYETTIEAQINRLAWDKITTLRHIAAVDIVVDSFNYLQREELDKFGVKDIIGEMGGVLGFWLGIDVIVVVHYIFCKPIIFLIGKCLQRKMPKTAPASSQNAQQETSSARRRVQAPENVTKRQT